MVNNKDTFSFESVTFDDLFGSVDPFEGFVDPFESSGFGDVQEDFTFDDIFGSVDAQEDFTLEDLFDDSEFNFDMDEGYTQSKLFDNNTEDIIEKFNAPNYMYLYTYNNDLISNLPVKLYETPSIAKIINSENSITSNDCIRFTVDVTNNIKDAFAVIDRCTEESDIIDVARQLKYTKNNKPYIEYTIYNSSAIKKAEKIY